MKRLIKRFLIWLYDFDTEKDFDNAVFDRQWEPIKDRYYRYDGHTAYLIYRYEEMLGGSLRPKGGGWHTLNEMPIDASGDKYEFVPFGR